MADTLASGNGARANRLRPLIWGSATCLLLLPAVAMRFFPSSGVEWSGGDFLVMGLLLAIACGVYELGARLSGSIAYRAGFGLASLAGLLTIWVNLAVGMLGSEDSSINLMFAGVLLIASAGATVAGFKPQGMSRAMLATAIAPLLVVAVGLSMGQFEPRELTLTAMFALPWLASATLFRLAARERRSSNPIEPR